MDLTTTPHHSRNHWDNDYQDVMKELNGDKRIVPITGNQPGEKVSTTMVKGNSCGKLEKLPTRNSTGATTNRDYVETRQEITLRQISNLKREKKRSKGQTSC